MTRRSGATVIVSVVLFLLVLPKHHRHKKPEPLVSVKQLQEDMEYLDKATKELQAFRDDVLYAQYKNAEIDKFANQLELCKQEMLGNDPVKFDADVNILLELGGEMESVDNDLHQENAI